MSKPIFPIVRERAPILDLFRQKVGVTPGTLTTSQRQMAEEFRRGMAEALGVPPEVIREELVQKWIVNWTRAFVKPEYWAEVAPTTEQIRDLGRQMGEIVRSALPAREQLGLMTQAQPPLAEQPQRAEKKPYSEHEPSGLSVVR